MTVPSEAERRIDGHEGVAHVATSVGARPHVAPVFYYYEDERLYLVTGGKKLENLRENPRVAVSLYERVGDHPEEVWQATVRGTATVVEDDWEQLKEYGDAIRRKYYGEASDEWPTEDDVLVRIDVGSVTFQDWTE